MFHAYIKSEDFKIKKEDTCNEKKLTPFIKLIIHKLVT